MMRNSMMRSFMETRSKPHDPAECEIPYSSTELRGVRYLLAGSQRWTVCRIGMSGDAGAEDLARAILTFYCHPSMHADATMELADKALWRKIMAAIDIESLQRPQVMSSGTKVRLAQEAIDKHEEVDDDHCGADASDNT